MVHHPNVLRVFGVTFDFGGLPSLVLPYCHAQTVVAYIKANPYAKRTELVSLVDSTMLPLKPFLLSFSVYRRGYNICTIGTSFTEI
jgi:hypothetical protein